MRYRKYITITDWRFWVVMALVGLIGLGVAVTKILTADHIEDLNGPDDPSLATITMEQILTTEVNYIASMGGNGGDGEPTGVEGDLSRYDWDNYRMKYKQFSGISTLMATCVTEPLLVLDFQTSLTAGNMEIVILIDGEYDRHVNLQGHQTVEIRDAVGKTVVVRMAAEGAEVDLKISRR